MYNYCNQNLKKNFYKFKNLTNFTPKKVINVTAYLRGKEPKESLEHP